MKNLYHKVAVTSVCTTLGFVLGASPEVKAASFTFQPAITFEVIDDGRDDISNFDGLGDVVFPASDFSIISVARGTLGETRSFTEFNIGSFSLAPNTVISRAVLQTEIFTFSLTSLLGIENPTNPGRLGLFGYVGNGTAEASDFETGVFLNSVDVSSSSAGDFLNFNVTPFINQRVRNGNAFAGFGIRALNFGGLFLENVNYPGIPPTLIIETADVAEPVPEPTTIFGSALALGVGGWLKRKKSSQQDKTAPQR
ncbi:MAG TPA: PEP-CTERM sorting domain-containing protein [Candidatus Sericytochromatia bacterium]